MDKLILMQKATFEDLKKELLKGVKDRDHGFHLPIFSNLNIKEKISSRIVVLRSFDSSLLKINFHSDIRSKKIQELYEKPETTFLFYDAKIKIQLKISALTKVHNIDSITKKAWSKTPLMSRKCYLTTKSPSYKIDFPTDGLPINLKGKNPTKEESELGYKNFAVLVSKIKTIEWLSLSSKGHRRLFIKISKNQQNFNWLIP